MNGEQLPAKALVKADLERDGVSIAVRRSARTTTPNADASIS